MTSKIYSTRSAAVRAARAACKAALSAPAYQAFEGPDYIIHPASMYETNSLKAGTYSGPSRFELRGPAQEA